jgi:hypothetical protein
MNIFMRTTQLSSAFIVLFLIVMMLMLTEARALEFKGIELGERLWISKGISVFGELDCNPMQLGADEYEVYLQELQFAMPGVRKMCVATTSIATVPADVTVALGSSRRVLRLTFQFAGEDYTQVIDAMSSKWGEGEAEVRGQFDESVWWIFDDGTSISVHQMPGTDDANHVEDFAPIGVAEYSLPPVTPEGDL